MVLGIVGKKGSGKDTFASFIQKHNREFKILHYADRLKYACANVFSFPTESYFDPELKEVPFKEPVVIDDSLSSLAKELGVELRPQNMVANNPRELLQFVGTQYVRNLYPTFWIDELRKEVEAEGVRNRLVIVPDVRFENEVTNITAMPDGIVIRVNRIQPVLKTDLHASEMEQEKILCPTLHVREGGLFVSELIACLFAKGQYVAAMDFIHRSFTGHPLDLAV